MIQKLRDSRPWTLLWLCVLTGCQAAAPSRPLNPSNAGAGSPVATTAQGPAVAVPSPGSIVPGSMVPGPVHPVAYQEPAAAAANPSGSPLAGDDGAPAPPLMLDEVISITMTTNPDLVSASEQISAASAAMCRARAEFYPKLGISEQYGVTNNPSQVFMYQLNQGQLSLTPTTDFNHPGSRDNFHTQLGLQHNIYAGQRRLHELQAAEAARSGAAFSLEALQNQLVFNAAEAYYRLLQAFVLVGVRQEAVDQVEQHLKIVQSRFRNGTAVKSDVLTVEVRLAEVREALIQAHNQLELGWSVLENVMGTSLARRPLPAEVTPAPWTEEVDRIEGAIAEALGRRAEVGVLSSQQQAASEQVGVAQSGKRLTADLLATYDLFTKEFDEGNDSYFVGVILQLNLFDGGRTDWDVARAAARVRELRARQQRLLRDIELDVRRSHLDLVSARQRLEVTTQAIGQAQESLREIEVRYRGQAATITQLLDSQVALSNARVRRANAAAEVEIARASLQRAVGRLADEAY